MAAATETARVAWLSSRVARLRHPLTGHISYADDGGHCRLSFHDGESRLDTSGRLLMSQFNFIIRPYSPADAAHLAALYFDSARTLGLRRYSPEQVAVWAPAPVSAERVHKRASDGRQTLVACGVDGALLAYGDLERNGHIDHLYAHPAASGRGVAGAVLNALIKAAEVAGIPELHVEASEVARGLFERAGFTVIQRRDFELNGVAIHNYAMTRAV